MTELDKKLALLIAKAERLKTTWASEGKSKGHIDIITQDILWAKEDLLRGSVSQKTQSIELLQENEL